MNRHEDDKPTLIGNEQEWINYVNKEMNVWHGNRKDAPVPYEYFKKYIDHPLEYPCMVISRLDCFDPTPGWDLISSFFYLDDARDLIIDNVLRRSVD